MIDKLRLARQLTEAAEQQAVELGINVATTVMDDAGNLIHFSRMDGTQLASSIISQGKAYSAVAFRRPTQSMYEVSQPGATGYALQAIDSRFVFAGGGMPVFDGDVLVGGIGISGGTAEQDQECAEAALAAVE